MEPGDSVNSLVLINPMVDGIAAPQEESQEHWPVPSTVALRPRSLDIRLEPLEGCRMSLDGRLVRGRSRIRIYRWDSIMGIRTVGPQGAMTQRLRDTALRPMRRRLVVRVR